MTRNPLLVVLVLAGAIGCGSSSSGAGGPDTGVPSGQDEGGSHGDDGGGGPGGDDATTVVPGSDGAAPDAAASTEGGTAKDGGLTGPTGRVFPDTTSSIAILTDQLPTMNMSQMQFATSHYVGTEKQLVPVTDALRALNPNFIVLHYHLSMWQSAEMTM